MTERKPQTGSSTTISENLRAVREEIASAAQAVDREPGAVTLVAVSKLQDEDKIRQTLKAGHRTFGENRVQEAKAKWPLLKNSYPDTMLHLIGPLQTNKAREAAEKLGRHPDLFIQVNTGEEPQNTGGLPAEAAALIATCRDDLGLPVAGLMCIPPHDEEPSLHFALLDEIARRNGLAGLSMGMSGDYPTAVRFGATHVRVGTGVFGPRLVPRDT